VVRFREGCVGGRDRLGRGLCFLRVLRLVEGFGLPDVENGFDLANLNRLSVLDDLVYEENDGRFHHGRNASVEHIERKTDGIPGQKSDGTSGQITEKRRF
jgi:hypothetical protein